MEQTRNEKKILIVDDDEAVLRILNRIMDKIERECTTVSSAEEARVKLKEDVFDLMLCDIRLPGESGMDLITHVISQYPDTAVIMVSGMEDPEVAKRAIEIGAYGYIIKPFRTSEVIINVSSALRRQSLEKEKRIYQGKLEKMVTERTTQLQETLEGVIKIIVHTVESRDPYTAGHQSRVAELALAIALKMELAEDHVKGLYMAGMIHDLGKISIPSEILSKPGRLNDMELGLIKNHPQVGYDILKGIDFPWPLASIVHQHHERIDGSGYPQGLKEHEILPEARILAVADVVEAMASHRPYRAALGIDLALDEISKNRGKLYDSDIADTCAFLFSESGFGFETLHQLI